MSSAQYDRSVDLSWLGVADWEYSRYFDRLPEPLFDVTDDLETLVSEAGLERHSFFGLAFESIESLELWVSQELIMTNAFSQIVLRAASFIDNVHARAILTEIAYGEHGRARNGFAKRAHPRLLDELRKSIGLSRKSVAPQPPTVDFMQRLVARIENPLDAVAFIGVGNERLIAPEYEGIRKCFRNLMPAADFEPFLKANIDEDITHSRLCYELASHLITSEHEYAHFLGAARASIDSRLKYFDDLMLLSGL